MDIAINMRLKKALYDAFHNSSQSPKEVAAKMGVKYSYLARAVLSGSSGCNFPIEWLVMFVRVTGRYTVLKVIVNAAGFLLVRRPRSVRSKDESQIISAPVFGDGRCSDIVRKQSDNQHKKFRFGGDIRPHGRNRILAEIDQYRKYQSTGIGGVT